jgi:beta-D-xylosidase 4
MARSIAMRVSTLGYWTVASSLASLVSAAYPDCSKEPLKSNDVCNTELDAKQRAAALIKEWTLEEKINNTQNASPGVPRLGIPAYDWWNEALHGVADRHGVFFAEPGEDFSYASSFPIPITMGSAFDDDLIFEVASIIGKEARAFGNGNHSGFDYWTPNINPFKDPRWGRGQETPGEDPIHLQKYVYQLLRGLEGDDDEYLQVAATCKHYAAYDLENWQGIDRFHFDAEVSTQDLNEYYLPTFKTCGRDFKVGAFMCSYNSINGEPGCANKYLLQDVLRDHWGWDRDDQWVTSDCGAIENIWHDHNFTEHDYQASAKALLAGTDLDCGTTFNNSLQQSYDEDLIKESDLDKALVRLYTSLIRTGYFDPEEKVSYRQLGWKDVNTEEAQKLAYKAAVEGIVVLDNKDKTLPLNVDKCGKVAVVGPYANATDLMLGNYFGIPPYHVTPLDAVKELGLEVSFYDQIPMNATNSTGIEEALEAAKDADTVLYFGGIDQSIEEEGLDRDTIVWPENQLKLIEQLAELKKTLVVVQFGGGQVDDTPLLENDNVHAIVWPGYPGQEGGHAIVDILTGKKAPAARLPITQYPGEYVDQVPMTDMSLRPSDDNPGRTYRWYNKEVLPFGHGLQYTTFDVSWADEPKDSYDITDVVESAKKDAEYIDKGHFDTYKVSVKNTGDVASDYVALLFLKTQNAGPAPYPRKTLIGYARAFDVQPGESKTVSIDVEVGAIARYDEQGNAVLYNGDYGLQVDIEGNDGPTAKFSLNGEAEQIEEFPQPK